MAKLKEGEKYISGEVNVGYALAEAHKAIAEGKNSFNFAVFNNKEGREKNSAAPHYRAEGVGLWINKKKDAATGSTTDEEDI